MAKLLSDEILLNKMFEGKYLDTNIGHEVINLIKADNGNNYIYVNPYGSVKENEHYRKDGTTTIKTILFVRNYGSGKILEVLAKAENLEPFYNHKYNEIRKKWDKKKEIIINQYKSKENKDWYKNEEYKRDCLDQYIIPMQEELHNYNLEQIKDIKYNGKGLDEIFADNFLNDRALYVTFKAKVLKINPDKRLFINFSIDDENKEYIDKISKLGEIINISGERFGQDLRKYIKDNKIEKSAYNILNQYIQEELYWEEIESNKIKTISSMIEDKDVNIESCKPNFLEIISQEYDELVHSNLLLHIFKSEPELFCEFAKLPKEDGGLGVEFEISEKHINIVREEGNIDLLIEDKKNKSLFVIENKIKSGINSIRYDETGVQVGNQLIKYIRYTHGEKVSKKNKNLSRYVYEEFSDEEKIRKPYELYENRKFYIFAPNYKHFDINAINKNIREIDSKYDDTYDLIEYSKLFEFFDSKKKLYENKISYYNEFLYAIKKHSFVLDNIKERRMFESFALKTFSIK